MTHAERLRAFEMRLNGATWAQIGAELNYDVATVYNDITCCIRSVPRQVRCCYPAIRQVIIRRHGGSIRAFADYCGLQVNTLYYLFSDPCRRPASATVDAILLATGLTYEEAFRPESKEE